MQRSKQRLNYHLKKTEPFKTQLKRTVTTQMKLYQRHEKVSTIAKKNILNFIKNQEETINQEHVNDNITQAASRVNICRTEGRANIFQRTNSQSKIKKLQIAQKGKSLKYWKAEESQPKIIMTLKGIINQLMTSQDGCRCGKQCQVKAMLLAWADVPNQLIKNNYRNLTHKLFLHQNVSKYQDTEWSSFCEEDNQQIQKQRQKIFKQIKKDIIRTQSTSQAFLNPQIQKKGERILMCYALEDPQIGYVQGMNMVMSIILYHIRDEAQSYAITRKLFHEIRSIYLNGFKSCYEHINMITYLFTKNIHDLHLHFQELAVDLKIILFPWIISLLSVIVPLDYMHLVYQGYIKYGSWNFIYRMILSIFIYNKEKLKQMSDSSDIFVYLSASNPNKDNNDWQDIYKYALSIKI